MQLTINNKVNENSSVCVTVIRAGQTVSSSKNGSTGSEVDYVLLLRRALLTVVAAGMFLVLIAGGLRSGQVIPDWIFEVVSLGLF